MIVGKMIERRICEVMSIVLSFLVFIVEVMIVEGMIFRSWVMS